MGLMQQPEFEDEAVTNSAEVATAPEAQAAPVQEATSTAAPAPAVVSPRATALAPATAKFQPAFADKQWTFPAEMVESLSLSAFRIKGEQGSCYHDQEDLGKQVIIEVVSWNPRWAIGTGSDKQTSEDKERFRVSYDGKVTTKGEDVAQYIQALKAEGYAKAKSATYIDLWGFMTWTSTKGEIAEDDRTLVMVQLSQTSAGAFQNYTVQRGMLESKGGQVYGSVKITAQAQANGSNKYTNFSFGLPKV